MGAIVKQTANLESVVNIVKTSSYYSNTHNQFLKKNGDLVKEQVSFNYDLSRMVERVENQTFSEVPNDCTTNLDKFKEWLAK